MTNNLPQIVLSFFVFKYFWKHQKHQKRGNQFSSPTQIRDLSNSGILIKSSVIKTKTLNKFINQGFTIKDSIIAVSEQTLDDKKQDKKKCTYCKGYEWTCKPDTIWNSKLFINTPQMALYEKQGFTQNPRCGL